MSRNTNSKELHMKASNKPVVKRRFGNILVFILLFAAALFMILPIYLTVIMSIKPVQEIFVFPPKLYVSEPTLSNYTNMFRICSDESVPFSRYVFNSIYVTAVVTIIQVIFSSMIAFCLAKVKFPGAKLINSIIVISLLYQSNVIYIMQYIVLAKMGIVNSMAALILPSAASPICVSQQMATGTDCKESNTGCYP